MKLSPPKIQRSYRPSRESLAGAGDVVMRLMNVRLTVGQLDTLDDGEAAEFVELIRKVERDENGERSTNPTRLGRRERARLETLIEACIETPGYFAHLRQQADTTATLEAMARKARTPNREAWQPPVGSVVLLSKDLLESLDRPDPALWLAHLAVLALVLAQIENGIALSPGARFEGGEHELALVLDRRLGLGERYDPDGVFGGWEKRLEHLALNEWLVVEHRGHEVLVRRGRRVLRAVKGSK
jgi:hypothetical protein